MSPRSVLTPEERDLVLRESSGSTHIPVRTPGRSAPASSDEDGKRHRLGGPAGPDGRSRRDLPSGGGGTPPSPPGGDAYRRPPRAPGPKSPRAPRRRRTIVVIAVLLLVVIGLAATKLLHVGGSVLSSERSILGQLADLLFRRGELKGERENRVNILLAAIGGEGHQGENLADTIVLASFRPKEGDVALLSIPRDLYVKVPDTDVFSRINAVHSYGENQRKGNGLSTLQKKISDITGQPVHYVARVDFVAFKRIVDEIGGIEITIPEGFYDYWHRINFPAGTEHMNGDRALAYVRARYIEGPQGGDFKRAARTQQVLLAIRKKVMSAQTAVDLRALAGVLDALQDNVSTNFTLAELKRLADLTRGVPDENMHTAVLTTGPDGLLVGTTETLGGRPASILRPRAGLENYGEIREFAADIFTRAKTPQAAGGALPPTPPPDSAPSPSPASPTPATSVASERPTVDTRNGTAVTGLASRVASTLKNRGFTMSAVGNAAIRNRTDTIVVDRTNGEKPESLRVLLDVLGVSSAVSFPEAEKAPADANFVVFLGTDVAEKFAP